MKTVINIKTDKALKAKVQRVAKELGLPVGTIVNNYFRHLVEEKRVTFLVPEIPNKKTMAQHRRALRDYKLGKNISRPFKTATEANAYLDSLS